MYSFFGTIPTDVTICTKENTALRLVCQDPTSSSLLGDHVGNVHQHSQIFLYFSMILSAVKISQASIYLVCSMFHGFILKTGVSKKKVMQYVATCRLSVCASLEFSPRSSSGTQHVQWMMARLNVNNGTCGLPESFITGMSVLYNIQWCL